MSVSSSTVTEKGGALDGSEGRRRGGPQNYGLAGGKSNRSLLNLRQRGKKRGEQILNFTSLRVKERREITHHKKGERGEGGRTHDACSTKQGKKGISDL